MNNKDFTYRFRHALAKPEDRDGKPPAPRTAFIDGMRIDFDVPIALRDGIVLRADIFRPSDETPVPPIIAWGPYGKHGHTNYAVNFPKAGVKAEHISAYTAFEAPNPHYWVAKGFAIINVDPRGTWHSEGRATYLSPEEALDFYDVIEWAGVQTWSNGKVGLSGVSYLTSAQWRVAELNPPHLAAINPWEGWTDTYREVAFHGGIPETSFWPYLPHRWGHGVGDIEDLARETGEHPFYDAFWTSKSCDFEKIIVPALVTASWSDQGLHTRGTLEGFKRIASQQKWLYVHGRKKWAEFYLPEAVEMQMQFFDHFLKGADNQVTDWPKVRLEVREKYYVGDVQAEDEWPIARTHYVPLYLDAQTERLTAGPSDNFAQSSYDSTIGRASFTYVFTETSDVIGHMSLRLHVSCDAGDDMDLFVAVQKLDVHGNIVPFAYYAQFEDGPVALGWLRVSHRELDTQRSTAFQPVLTHARQQNISPGEIVPVEIEIWPSGTRFETGEQLHLIVQGCDIYDYPKPSVYARHESGVNAGNHTIHTGGIHDSRLLLPLVPAKNR